MEKTHEVALTRLGLVASDPQSQTPALLGATLAELSAVGVRVINPSALGDDLAVRVRDVAEVVAAQRGKRGAYAPLFKGFPDALPSSDDAELRFSLARARLSGVVAPDEDDLRDALDFSSIQWWPASSVPLDVNAALGARQRQLLLAGDPGKVWRDVTVVTPTALKEALRTWARAALGAPTSLRADVRSDVDAVLDELDVAVELVDVPFRETRTLVLRRMWEADPSSITTSGATPDDLLRLMADLTGTDTSLSGDVRWPRLKRSERRALVNTLEASPRLPELFRRRDLWLALSKGLHAGEFRAPRLNEALTRLRASRHDATSVLARFEAALASDPGGAAELLVAEAPTVLVRQLGRVLRAASADTGAYARVLDALKGVKAPLRVLLSARGVLADNGASYPRVAFDRSGRAMLLERPRTRTSLPAAQLEKALAVLDALTSAGISERSSWAGVKVWVDPALKGVLVPTKLRSTSASAVQAERGTRLPLGDGKVLRLFTHWMETEGGGTSDLDLSVAALGDDFAMRDHVSWTNLANGVMTHSGDVTSAPFGTGAQEFIDVNLVGIKAEALKRGWRYLAPVVLRYSGPAFGDLEEAVAGWMLRDDASRSRRTFDVATVVDAFDLTGRLGTSVPFLVDLVTDEVVVVDTYLASGVHASVTRDEASITGIARALVTRAELEPDVHALAVAHVRLRGAELVEDREDASVTFGLGGGATYSATAPEALLAELL
jgi:hypothetical protein